MASNPINEPGNGGKLRICEEVVARPEGGQLTRNVNMVANFRIRSGGVAYRDGLSNLASRKAT